MVKEKQHRFVTVPATQSEVSFMKDSKRFPDTKGWVRRRFLCNAVVAPAGAELVPFRPADGQSSKEARVLACIRPGTNSRG
jgi:hypothetical protein